MTSGSRDRWYIPPPIEAVTAPAPAEAEADRLGWLADIGEASRMAEILAFLAGYAPGVFDAIVRATEPCLADVFPDELPMEPFCTECGARAGVFTGRGGDWLHYSGTPEGKDVAPYAPGHAPVIGWRPATDGPAVVVL